MRGLANVALLAALGCVGPRYGGAFDRSGTYVNRGYGLVLPVASIAERWWVFDPEHPNRGPPGLTPARPLDRIDLDGDGMLRLDEFTPRYQPVLRLLARTATAARIELEVEILSEPAASEVTLRGLFDSEVRSRAGNATAARLAITSAERLTLGLGREAWVTSIVGVKGGGALRLALVDQPGFSAEPGRVRRQLVRLALIAPTLKPTWLNDHAELLRGLIAAQSAGPTPETEQW